MQGPGQGPVGGQVGGPGGGAGPRLAPGQGMETSVPQPGGGPRAAASPPTKLAGAGQLPASPVRNLFPDTGRTQSRSSTLVDAESLQEDKSKPWTRSSSVFTVTCFRSVIPAAAAGSVRDPVPGW